MLARLGQRLFTLLIVGLTVAAATSFSLQTVSEGQHRAAHISKDLSGNPEQPQFQAQDQDCWACALSSRKHWNNESGSFLPLTPPTSRERVFDFFESPLKLHLLSYDAQGPPLGRS